MPVIQITRKTRMTGKQTFLKTENSRKMDPLMVTWTFFVFSINNICTIESYVREKRRVSKGLLGQETGQVERREWEQLGVVGRKHVKEAGRKEAKWGEEETGRRRDRREEKGTIDYDKTNCIGRFLREILSKPYQICFWTQKSNGLQTLFWNVTSKWFITGQVVHNSSSLVVWLESWVLYFMYKATVWYTWKVDGGKGMIFYCERNAVKTWWAIWQTVVHDHAVEISSGNLNMKSSVFKEVSKEQSSLTWSTNFLSASGLAKWCWYKKLSFQFPYRAYSILHNTQNWVGSSSNNQSDLEVNE